MQGPFDQQTDTAGLLHAATRRRASHRNFAQSLFARVRDSEPIPSARPSSKAVAELDSNLPTYFAGTPAQFHNEILGGNRNYRDLIRHFRSRRIRALGGWSLRRDELFRYSANAGIWHPYGAGRGCRSHLSHGHDARRLAAGHRTYRLAPVAPHCFSEFSPPLLCRTFSSRSTPSIPSFISRLRECSPSSPRHLASCPHAAPPGRSMVALRYE